MRVILHLLFAALIGLQAYAWAVPANDMPATGSGGVNAPQHHDKPHVVLVSLDGFRWDYAQRFPTPNIQRLLASGTQAEYLTPVWPTLTFPNHYSQVTGLLPAEHGLVGNNFPLRPEEGWYRMRDRDMVGNGALYRGTPIWVLAEQQGMVSASYFWVGSEAAIQGIHPTHWYPFDYRITHETRVDQVIDWLQEPPETRPHMITLYLGTVDDTSHRFGIGSEEMIASINTVDQTLGTLMDRIDALDIANTVYLVVVSDHGQMGYRDDPPFVLEEYISLDGLEVIDGGSMVFIWGTEPEQAAAMAATINAAWSHGTAYTRSTAPKEWAISDDPRFPDLVVQAEGGYAVLSNPGSKSTISPGDHGWTPETPEMRGIFWMRGPGIAAGETIPPMDNTDIFPLMLDWLELDPPPAHERANEMGNEPGHEPAAQND